MKASLPYFMLVLAGAVTLVCAQDVPGPRPLNRMLVGWGEIVDPDSDCGFFLSDKGLMITTPGSRPHDLAADINTVNAPRVIGDVRGDFTLQVCVDGRFEPGDESTKAGRVGYNGGAIVAMADTKNVVTLARAVLQHQGQQAQGYANFEIRSEGKLLRIGLTGDHPLPLNGPVHLRLERRGDVFLGAVSKDGFEWKVFGSKPVPSGWPKALKAGVAAISTAKSEFAPRFSKLQVLN